MEKEHTRAIITNGKQQSWVTATVNGKQKQVLIDSGASIGVIPPELIKENPVETSGRKVMLQGAIRGWRQPVKVNFLFGDQAFVREAVVSTEDDDFHGIIFPWNVKSREENQTFVPLLEETATADVNVITRAQQKKSEEQDRNQVRVAMLCIIRTCTLQYCI